MDDLKILLVKAEKQLRLLPKGKLIITRSHNTFQYRYKNESGKRVYIRKSNQELIQQLAQKRYLEAAIKVLKKQNNLFRQFNQKYDKDEIYETYNKLPTPLKKYVQPLVQSYEEYGAQWIKKEYKRKAGQQSYSLKTDNGEMVRSKSELIIANKLKSRHIYYRYECQKYMEGFGVIYPDFTILDPATKKEVLLEHFGLMDNPNYVQIFINKMKLYTKNGYIVGQNLICTFETAEQPLDMFYLDMILDSYFKKT